MTSLPGPQDPEAELAHSLVGRMKRYRKTHRHRSRVQRFMRFVFGQRNYRHGVTRMVILTKRYAIKMPRLDSGFSLLLTGWLGNRQENKCWQHAKGWKCTKGDVHNDPQLHLAPVYRMYFLGLVLVMGRCKEITQEEGKAFIEAEVKGSATREGTFDWTYWCTDHHSGNFGRYEGRIVCLDYTG